MLELHKRFPAKLLWLIPGFFVVPLLLLSLKWHSGFEIETWIIKTGTGASLLESLKKETIVSVSRPYYFSSDPNLRRVYKVELAGRHGTFDRLQARAGVDFLARDSSVVSTSLVASDPQFTLDPKEEGKQWWLAKIKAPEAWDISTGGRTVNVAVVDTGINGKHEDLSDGRVGSGYVSYCQVSGSSSGQCLVHIAGTVAANENSDDNGHGTIVAGIIGAIPNNSKGIAGINWNVRLMPVKVLDNTGNGVSSDVAAGIVWAVDNGAHIVNLSLGGTSIEGNAVLNQAIAYAFGKGVLVVAAAGNDSALVGADLDVEPVYPVCNDGDKNMVLGVGAVDINDKKAAFSSFGRACIDLVAPGTAYFNSKEDQKGIISTYFDPKQPTKNNLYVYGSGTSMAAPMVSGVAALLKSKHPDLSGTALRDRLINSAADIDPFNLDNCKGLNCTGRLGNGRLDALRALQTTTFISDSLIRDSSGRVYLIDSGLRRLVSDYVFSQRGFKKENIKDVSVAELELLPQGYPLPPLDGALVKGQSDLTVHVVSAGVLQAASLLAFRSYSYTFDRVEALPDSEISSYRKGPDLTPANGALLKLSGNPAVYFLHEGKRRLLSAFTFRNRGLKFSDVVEVSPLEFERYPSDSVNPLQPPLDGTLVKGDASPTVYVFEDGQKRALSVAAFAERKYQFSQVVVLPHSEVEGYVEGTPIR